jgi:hypothetical protein
MPAGDASVAPRRARILLLIAGLLALLGLGACGGPRYWSFPASRAVYDHMDGERAYTGAMAHASGSDGNPAIAVLFLLPIVIDLVLLPLTGIHDLFVLVL